jgi:hypothetical protein
MRKTINELLHELKKTTNPVTYLALKECIIDRLNRKDVDQWAENF